MNLFWKHSYCIVVIAHENVASSDLKKMINLIPVAKKILVQFSNMLKKEEIDERNHDIRMQAFDNVHIAFDSFQGNYRGCCLIC